MKVKVWRNSAKSKFYIDVDPNKGNGYWTFKVQKKRANGTWYNYKTYNTSYSTEKRTLNLPKGTYRAVVQAKYGYRTTTSGSVYLKK